MDGFSTGFEGAGFRNEGTGIRLLLVLETGAGATGRTAGFAVTGAVFGAISNRGGSPL